MKWRDTTYNARYVVQRVCRELGASPEEVWEIMDQEFDKEPGESMTAREAADLEEIVLAGLRADESRQPKLPPPEWLTRHQAAALLHIHVNTLDMERAAGRLAYTQRRPGGRVLIARKDVEDYLKKGRHLALPERCIIQTYRKPRDKKRKQGGSTNDRRNAG